MLLAFLMHAPLAFAQSGTAKESALLRWMIAGPFPVSGGNALFVDYLNNSGGEARVLPHAGGVAATNQAGALHWQMASTSTDGSINFRTIWPDQKRAVAYAYTELESGPDGYAVATVGSGNNIQIILNGEVIFESRLSRKPESDRDTLVLPLKRGVNPLLVKVEGDPDNWLLQLKVHSPAGNIFINQHATIIPDFRVGDRTSAWGQVELANASGSALTGVTVEALGDDLVLPSRSAATTIGPRQVQRIPLWIESKKAAPENAVGPIRLRIASGREEQVIEFAPRIKKRTDYFVTTYRSTVDGSIQPYSLLLPTSFDPAETYPLILLLHGAHVTDWGQNIIAYDPKEWAIQMAVHDRGNNRYRDIGEVDLNEALSDVRHRFKIDPDRTYLSGHSMGGYGTWFQATRHPDHWAAISPQAGYTDYSLYNPVMGGAGTQAQQQFEDQLLTNWSPLAFAENLLNVPAYIVHGAKDDNVSVEHSRKMAALLKGLGYNFVYDENPDGGHWWGPRGKYYGVEVVDKPPIWTFFQKHSRRALAPKHVIYKTDSLRYREAYWVEIDELDKTNQLARIEAESAGPNTIVVHTSNISQFTLRLDKGDLVKPDLPVTVNLNDQAVFNGHIPLSGRLTLRRGIDGRYLQLLNNADLHVDSRDAAQRAGLVGGEIDQQGKVVRYSPRDVEELKKSPQHYGPVIDAFNQPFLFVVGTVGGKSGSVELLGAARRSAEAIAREWMQRAAGIVEIKRDIDVTPDDIATRNLVLFGSASSNSLIAQINEELPIRFAGTSIWAGGRIITGEDLGLIMAVPNPLNQRRYAVIVGGTTPRSFETAGRLRLTDLPDYVIFDRKALAGNQVAYLSGGFFDKYWRLADPEVIGEANVNPSDSYLGSSHRQGADLSR
jgi:pimeloyl-ACP methyl ester carboxylesterase